MGQIDNEKLLQFIEVSSAHERGKEKRSSFQDEHQSETVKNHEKNVKLYWEEAVTEFMERCIKSSYARKSGKNVTTLDLNLEKAMIPCVEFLSAHMVEDLNGIILKVRSCADDAMRKAKVSASWFYWILLGVALFGSELLGLARFFWFFFALITIVLFGSLLYFSRKHALNEVFKNQRDPVNMMEDYCDVCAKSSFQLISKPWAVIISIIVLAILAYGMAPLIPKTKVRQIQNALAENQYSLDAEALDNILLTDSQITKDAHNDFIKAYDSQASGSVSGLRMAIYANNRTDRGFSSAEAETMLDEQIKNLDLAQINSNTLNILNDAFTLSGRTIDSILPGYLETGSSDNTDLAEWFGRQYSDSGLSFREIYNVSSKIAEAGLPSDAFLLPAVSKQELKAEAIDFMREEKDKNSVVRLARLYAENINDLDDAVLLIGVVRNKDLSMKETFPDGIEIDSFDLRCLNQNYSPDSHDIIMTSDFHYLILSRTEKDEPFEGVKPRVNSDLFNPIGSSYDGNDKNDPSTFTVKIETDLLDRIPLENFPSEKDECNLLIVMDTQFSLAGSIEYYYTMKDSRAYDYTYYPVYYRVYSIAMIERNTKTLEYFYDRLAIEPESVNKEESLSPAIQATYQAAGIDSATYNRIFNSKTYEKAGDALDEIRKVYLAPEDPNWFSKNMEEFLDLLDFAEWNNNHIQLMNAMTAPETEE